MSIQSEICFPDVISGGGGTPGGTNGQIQYNNSGSFGGISTTGSGNVVLASAPTLVSPVVGTQSVGDNTTKAASTAYVTTAINNAMAGVDPILAADYATTTNIIGVYNNGSSGTGATYTTTATGVLTIDGQVVTLGDVVLLKDLTGGSGAYNGLFTVTTAGAIGIATVFTRSADYNSPSNINNTAAIPVKSGTSNGGTSWLLTSKITTIGTDAITYTKFTQNPNNVAITGGSINGTTVGATTASSGAFTTLSASGHTTFEGVTSTGATGTGNLVYSISPLLTTPNIGAASGTSLSLSGLTASQAVVTDGSKNLTSLAYNSTATANNLARWDSSTNFQANMYVRGYSAVTAAGGTTTLTSSSSQYQYFTGSANQTVILPDATTLKVGSIYEIFWTGITLSLKDGGSNTIATIAGYCYVKCILTNNGSTAGTWNISNQYTTSSVGGAAIMRDASGNFSANNITAAAFISSTSNPASTGLGRLASTDGLYWRNNANSSNLGLTKDTTDALGWAGNFAANNFVETLTSIATAGGTTTLTVSSAGEVEFTGSSAQNVVLPDATTCRLYTPFKIIKKSVGAALTIKDAASTTLITTATDVEFIWLVLTANGTAAGTWDIIFRGTSGGTTAGSFAMRNAAGDLYSSGFNGVFKSTTSNISTSGILRTASTDAIFGVRNNANSADLTLTKDTSDIFSWPGRLSIPSLQQPFATGTDAATVTLDFATSNNFNLTLGGSRTLGVPNNLAAGQNGVITVRQDATGSRTLSYAWCYVFPQNIAPTLSTGKYVMDQLNYVVNGYSTATVTMTIATPCVVTWTGHGLVSGQRIQFTTTGALPTGLSTATTYWINVIDANTFNVSSSLANLQAGTYIATSGSQSGTHTATQASITLTSNLNMGGI